MYLSHMVDRVEECGSQERRISMASSFTSEDVPSKQWMRFWTELYIILAFRHVSFIEHGSTTFNDIVVVLILCIPQTAKACR